MSLPGNGIYVVRGEMATLMTAMRRGSRWNSTAYADEEKDGLMKLFVDLKQVLNRIEDLRHIDPNVYLAPFLEVIRAHETTGAVTSLALVAINKFLSYGLIDPTTPNLAVIVEHIVDAVTHARFMGTDNSTDGVTLLRVVEVLHTLMRSPEGSALSNESVCELLLSCFKICFEPRLNELLRRSAEQALKDMVLLFFMRLPQFSEERNDAVLLGRFQIGDTSMQQDKKKRKKSIQQPMQQKPTHVRNHARATDERKISSADEPQTPQCMLPVTSHLKVPPLATTPATPAGNILDMQGKITQTPTTALSNADSSVDTNAVPNIQVVASSPEVNAETSEPTEHDEKSSVDVGSSEYINSVGVRFTQQNSIEGSDTIASTPYGLPFIKELFRFLILLCNPLDKQNTDNMMHTGLSLLTVAFEVAADNIGKYETLLELVKDDLCRNLISLMNSERLSIFAADLQLCFLLFESLRGHLKFQLEAYLKKLTEIIASDNPKTPYEMRELALDNLLQLWRIPGFVTELYINYDCDLYCTDMFESLTNLLSKYTLSATNAVYGTHIIAMDTLISVIDSVEHNCIASKSSNGAILNNGEDNETESGSVALPGGSRHSRHNSGLEGIVIDSGNHEERDKIENISKFINNSTRLRLTNAAYAPSVGASKLSRAQLSDVKQKKRVLSQGTELFNQRPDKGILFLQENGILNGQLDPMEVALFLRENSGLDKKMIGEYISRKKNVDSKILMNFVDSFDFSGLRVDQALRLYLETFRLPGEAPLIFLVLEHFADHWHKQNGEPFANTDAAFSLAYAIIMLNMDQHNSNAKRLNVPMTQEDFLKNLRGLNGGSDFDQDMLSAIFNAIKNEEIVMPAEQTGLVRENYLWKVLLRRGATKDGIFHYVQDASYDIEIFNMVWGATLSALSFMFDRSSDQGYQRTLTGFTKCAAISAHYNLHDDFDALILTLCKFTTLLNTVQQDTPTPAHNDIVQAVNFGLNTKAQAAIRTVFLLVHEYGDCLREEGWKNILELFLQLFRLKLLPKSLIEVEDFCEANGKAQLILEKPREKQEAGLFSSLYSYLSSEGQRDPTYEELEYIKIAKKCIKECQLEQMLQESKFVQHESLQELLKCVLSLIKAPNAHKSIGMPYAEDVVVFWMEFLVKIVVHNRDRMIPLWPSVRDHMYLLLMGSASCGYDYLLNRCIVGVLKIAIYLMRNEELCPIVLQSLKMLLMLKPAVVLRISKQISIGIYELLKTSAQNIHSEQDWQIIFTILECVGAGAVPPEFEDANLPVPNSISAKSDGALSSEEDSGLPDRGYTSDSEVSTKQQLLQHEQEQKSVQSNANSPPHPSSPTAENWILVNKDTDLTATSRPQSPPPNVNTLVYKCKLFDHSPFALFKCWDSLAFIVRNVAHITPYNFESCVRCIRTFVEACRDGGIRQRRLLAAAMAADAKHGKSANRKANAKRLERDNARKANGATAASSNLATSGNLISTSADNINSLVEADNEDLAQRYETLSIQLLDLMYTLYTRTAQIFRWWAEEGCTVPQCSALWAQGWCPLLQGIARLAMDRRREVRTYAISCLQQRALLVHDLQTLSGAEWAACFQQVLFPLLNQMLPDSPGVALLDPVLLEESRIRTATIMSKVFLHHLTPLIEQGNAFNELWIEILDYIEKFMKVGSDMLSEQMQEILKNMLLVMHSVRIFHHNDGSLNEALWDLTWDRIGEFLPNLKDELFRDEGKRAQVMQHISNTGQSPPNQEPNNIASVPTVAILPKTLQPAQIPTDPSMNSNTLSNAELVVNQAAIVSPVESPRHSIILQPPAADMLQGANFILAQSTHMPILVPPQPLPAAAAATAPVEAMPIAPPAELTAAAMTATTTAPAISNTLPDLVNEASKQSQQTADTPNDSPKHLANVAANETATSVAQVACDTYSFAIELPETPPAIDNYSDYAPIQEQQLLQHYQQYFQQQQQQQQSPVSLPNASEQNAAAPALHDASMINVPISHLLAGNQYPSLPKMPNAAIVHSFSPVYMQTEPTQGGADIYQEYVQNPYNLTLQQQQQQGQQTEQHQQQQQLTVTATSASTSTATEATASLGTTAPAAFFGSTTNYFNTNVDPSQIPPGSELLYGQQ